MQKSHSQTSGCVVVVPSSTCSKRSANVELWHQRLGHASKRSLNKLILVKSDCIAATLNNCTIFLMQNKLEIFFPLVVYKLQLVLILYTWMCGSLTKYLHLMVTHFFLL